MKPRYKGLVVAVLHLALVASLGGKLLYDRATRPRVWARTANYDPDLPIRGRYVSLSIEVTPEGFITNVRQGNKQYPYDFGYGRPVKLDVRDGKLVALLSSEDTNVHAAPQMRYLQGKELVSEQVYISEPVAFFIPEHAPNPSWRAKGEELWVEVTVPKKGPPRPLRLGVKKDGVLKPLELN